MKFLVNKVGIEEFRELVRQEREILPHDERWVSDIEQRAHWFQNLSCPRAFSIWILHLKPSKPGFRVTFDHKDSVATRLSP